MTWKTFKRIGEESFIKFTQLLCLILLLWNTYKANHGLAIAAGICLIYFKMAEIQLQVTAIIEYD